jgi:glycerol-3-phosphate cytidylyltransferase
MKPRMLFVDDRTKRIHAALEKYSAEWDLTIATNVLETLRCLSQADWDVLDLDCDLGGQDFCPLDEDCSIMELVRYLEKTGWPPRKKKPRVILHSSNIFASYAVGVRLKRIFGNVEYARFIYPEEKKKKYNTGIVAGAFDIIHPGYIALLEDADSVCEHLIVALHEDPSVENKKKDKPVLSVHDRKDILLALRYVDEVLIYQTEADLLELLKKIQPNVRILGSDYREKPITGAELDIPVYYHARNHSWSASMFKRMIANSVEEK